MKLWWVRLPPEGAAPTIALFITMYLVLQRDFQISLISKPQLARFPGSHICKRLSWKLHCSVELSL